MPSKSRAAKVRKSRRDLIIGPIPPPDPCASLLQSLTAATDKRNRLQQSLSLVEQSIANAVFFHSDVTNLLFDRKRVTNQLAAAWDDWGVAYAAYLNAGCGWTGVNP